MSLRHIFAQSIGFFTALETLKAAFLKQPEREGLEYYVTSLIGAVLAILLPILIALIVGFLLILFVWWRGRQRRKKATA